MKNFARLVGGLGTMIWVVSACGGDDATGTSGTEQDAGVTTTPTTQPPTPPVPSFTVSGTVSGLKGSGLELALNGGDKVTPSGTSFAFANKVKTGDAYQVTVSKQPASPSQTCTVTNGAGTIASANIENVSVTCVDDKFPVNVVVTGLAAGSTLALVNNGGDDLTVTMAGNVAFPTALLDGAAYAVTVKTPPTAPPQTCNVTNGAGTIAGAAATVNVACSKDWANAREVTVTSDLAAAATNEPVLVVLDAAFTYAKTAANGADLRFSTTAAQSDSLPYYIETWNPAGTSYVWVRVPNVPVGASKIHMFYNRPTATAASAFATVFPNAQITAGGGAGNLTPAADIAVDWFELAAGDTLTLTAGTPLVIDAKRIRLTGNIVGNGLGYAGPTTAAVGNGPGGGGTSTTAGAGGGAYGGNGGTGGLDSGDSPGAGGAAYGTETGTDIAMGSAGGNAGTAGAGSGGGAVTLKGRYITAPGTISLNGTGTASCASGRCSGGGAGGGLLAMGVLVDFSTGTVTANGGAGDPGTSTANDSGGGGGGGRIKFFARSAYTAPATTSVAFGVGGPNGSMNGSAPGVVGTTYNTNAALAADVPAVISTVGAEN